MKTLMKFNLSLLTILMSLEISHATPWFTQDPKTLPQGNWRFEEHIMYSKADSGLADGVEATLPFVTGYRADKHRSDTPLGMGLQQGKLVCKPWLCLDWRA